jgi:hypothetical protein
MNVGLAVERPALTSGFGLLGKDTRILKILNRVKKVDLCGLRFMRIGHCRHNSYLLIQPAPCAF